MIVSPNGIKLIQTFESFSPTAYLDSVSLPTIGYGTTRYPNGSPVKLGDRCTIDQANQFMQHDLEKFETAVSQLITANIHQEQFDACVSLTYNIGVANFERSSVLRNTNVGDWQAAQRSFLLWNKIRRGTEMVPLKGLTRRRLTEAALYGPLSAQQLIALLHLEI